MCALHFLFFSNLTLLFSIYLEGFRGLFVGLLWVLFWGCFGAVLWLFRGCCGAVSWLFCGCFGAAVGLFWGCCGDQNRGLLVAGDEDEN
jgi:hypothetical protein